MRCSSGFVGGTFKGPNGVDTPTATIFTLFFRYRPADERELARVAWA